MRTLVTLIALAFTATAYANDPAVDAAKAKLKADKAVVQQDKQAVEAAKAKHKQDKAAKKAQKQAAKAAKAK